MDPYTFYEVTNLHCAAERGLLNVVKFLIDKAKDFSVNNETKFKVKRDIELIIISIRIYFRITLIRNKLFKITRRSVH